MTIGTITPTTQDDFTETPLGNFILLKKKGYSDTNSSASKSWKTAGAAGCCHTRHQCTSVKSPSGVKILSLSDFDQSKSYEKSLSGLKQFFTYLVRVSL
jgi:hypothetical protein